MSNYPRRDGDRSSTSYYPQPDYMQTPPPSSDYSNTRYLDSFRAGTKDQGCHEQWSDPWAMDFYGPKNWTRS